MPSVSFEIRLSLLASASLALSLASESAAAHGFAGKRFFPATISTDDPFVADELSLPTVSRHRARKPVRHPRGHRHWDGQHFRGLRQAPRS